MRRPAGSWWAVLAVLALLAAACTSGDDDAGGDGAATTTIPSASTLLRVASGEWTDCLHPLRCDDEIARTLVLEHVLPKLMEVDEAGGYVPSPVLAERPEVRVEETTGEQTVEFRIAEDARWHDGRPITSSDVVGTWLAHLDTPGADTRGHSLITEVDDTDPLVARVTLSEPYADWPELFGGYSGWLLQADAFGGDTDLTGRFDDFIPFGAGPYELVSFGERALVLVAREDHWAPERQAATDQVRIEYVESVSESEGSIPGGIDVVLPAVELDDVPAGFQLRQVRTAEVVGLMLDRRTPPLGSAGVRAAIDAALDRDELADVATGAREAPEVVTCLAALPQDPACADQLPVTDAEPDEARALLDGDGWPADPETGERGRPGLPLATPVTHDPGLPGGQAVAEEIADALAAIGFTVDVQEVEPFTWLQPDRDSGTGVGVFAVPLGTAQRLAGLYRCGFGELNPLGWCDEAVQALVDELLVTVDGDRRDELQAAIGEAAAEARTWLPLHQRTRQWLLDDDRVVPPSSRPLGSGPLGALHAFERTP